MDASELYFILAKKDVNDAKTILQEGVTKCPDSAKLKTFLKQLSDVTVINDDLDQDDGKLQTKPGEEEKLTRETAETRTAFLNLANKLNFNGDITYARSILKLGLKRYPDDIEMKEKLKQTVVTLVEKLAQESCFDEDNLIENDSNDQYMSEPTTVYEDEAINVIKHVEIQAVKDINEKCETEVEAKNYLNDREIASDNNVHQQNDSSTVKAKEPSDVEIVQIIQTGETPEQYVDAIQCAAHDDAMDSKQCTIAHTAFNYEDLTLSDEKVDEINTTEKLIQDDRLVTTEGSQEDVKQCNVADRVSIEGDFEKAERPLKKVEGICPTQNARQKSEEMPKENTMDANASDEDKNNIKPMDLTKKHISVLENVKKAQNVICVPQCLSSADAALKSGNMDKALNMLEKANRLDPNLEVKEKLNDITHAIEKKKEAKLGEAAPNDREAKMREADKIDSDAKMTEAADKTETDEKVFTSKIDVDWLKTIVDKEEIKVNAEGRSIYAEMLTMIIERDAKTQAQKTFIEENKESIAEFLIGKVEETIRKGNWNAAKKMLNSAEKVLPSDRIKTLENDIARLENIKTSISTSDTVHQLTQDNTTSLDPSTSAEPDAKTENQDLVKSMTELENTKASFSTSDTVHCYQLTQDNYASMDSSTSQDKMKPRILQISSDETWEYYENHLEKAAEASLKKDFRKARRLLETAIKVHPTPEAYMRLDKMKQIIAGKELNKDEGICPTQNARQILKQVMDAAEEIPKENTIDTNARDEAKNNIKPMDLTKNHISVLENVNKAHNVICVRQCISSADAALKSGNKAVNMLEKANRLDPNLEVKEKLDDITHAIEKKEEAKLREAAPSNREAKMREAAKIDSDAKMIEAADKTETDKKVKFMWTSKMYVDLIIKNVDKKVIEIFDAENTSDEPDAKTQNTCSDKAWDDYEDYLEKAREASLKENFRTARRFLEKAVRIHPTKEAKISLDKIKQDIVSADRLREEKRLREAERLREEEKLIEEERVREEERFRKEEKLKEEERLRKLESLRLRVDTEIGEEKYKLHVLAHEAAFNKKYNEAKVHAEKAIEVQPNHKTIELLDYIVENITRKNRERKGITYKAAVHIIHKSYLDRANTYIRKGYLNCAEVYLEKWMRCGTDPEQASRASELSKEYLEARLAQVFNEVNYTPRKLAAYLLVKRAVEVFCLNKQEQEEFEPDLDSAEKLLVEAHDINPGDVTRLLRAVKRFKFNIPRYAQANIKRNCVIS